MFVLRLSLYAWAMDNADIISDELDAIANDPLFRRLWVIRQEVEGGTADAETVERWTELRDTVAVIVSSLKATLADVPHEQRDKVARDWIQAFTDEHWPQATRH